MTIENAKITNVSLSMGNYGCLTLEITLSTNKWTTCYGGYCLGKGYLGAKEFVGSAKGMEAIMRIMDTVGVEELSRLEGKYVRVKDNGWGSPITAIGNIVEDKWFDYEKFFAEEK